MPGISTFLWFNKKAENAAKFYVSIFKGARITGVSRYPEGPRGKPGSVMTVTLKLGGNVVTLLNGGPVLKLNSAFSFVVTCGNQKEIDYYWKSLLRGGGKPVQCGWLTDRFGVSWQVVPDILYKLIKSKDPAVAARVNAAMLKMIKFDISELKKAGRQRTEDRRQRADG